jgi:Na+:H+ antiporter, NhaA family
MDEEERMTTRETTKKTNIEILQEFSIPLIAGVVIAVIWANIDIAQYRAMVHYSPFGEGNHFNFHFLWNDIFMPFFFGIAVKEIVESFLPGGALNPVKKAINPLVSTVGGVLGPVAVYFGYCHLLRDTTILAGWGIPTATDIALAWLAAKLILGKSHPGVNFLLLLAIADDAIGLGIIAVFYPDPVHPTQPIFLLITAGGTLIAYLLKRSGVKNFWAYIAVPGVLSWIGLFMAHLHPALALVSVVPFMPHAKRDTGLYENTNHLHDTMNEFEHFFKRPVDMGLFFFGLVNAGVEFSSIGNATYAVVLGLLLGKTVGIVLFSGLASLIGFKLPEGMEFRDTVVVAIIAGLGLTVALFVAEQAFADPIIGGAAKMGALLSVLAAPLAFGVAKALGVKKVKDRNSQKAPLAEATEF